MGGREDGFYWVKWPTGWSIAEWVSEGGMDSWFCPNMEGSVPESCFEEIGGRACTGPAP